MEKQIKAIYLFDDNISADDYQELLQRSSAERKTKAQGFYSSQDSVNCVIAGLLVNLYIKNEISSLNSLNYFFKDSTGKPFVEIDGKIIYVSISHSYRSVCVVVSDHNIGVDVQSCLVNLDESFVAANFHDKEISNFDGNRHLIRTWATKEAYLKQTGEGISRDFKSLQVFDKFILDQKKNTKHVIDILIDNDTEALVVVDALQNVRHYLIKISLTDLKELPLIF